MNLVEARIVAEETNEFDWYQQYRFFKACTMLFSVLLCADVGIVLLLPLRIQPSTRSVIVLGLLVFLVISQALRICASNAHARGEAWVRRLVYSCIPFLVILTLCASGPVVLAVLYAAWRLDLWS
jgi:hypothetical protein